MHRKSWLWLVLLLSPGPLFFNCQPSGRLQFDGNASSESASNRGPASDDDQSVVAFATEERQKVELDPSTLIAGGADQSAPTGPSLATKASAASSSSFVPAGLRLFVLIDNECLNKRLERRAHGRMKATPPTLAEEALAHSNGRIADLKLQAYSVENPSPKALEELTQEAESDECVHRIANDQILPMIDPRVTRPEGAATATTSHSVHETSLAQKAPTSLEAGLTPIDGTTPEVRIQAANNDPLAEEQAQLLAIGAHQGWNVFYSPTRGISTDVVVAIVDSGIDYRHNDLAANMWSDSQGRSGRDFQNLDNDPMDDHGHGTHVAGIVGAVSNNGVGISGVMGSRVRLMSVKVVDASGSGAPSTVANGVRWAADNGAEVINMSLAYPALNTEIRDAVAYATSKGAVVIAAAGNDGAMLSTTSVQSPAIYSTSIPGLLTVGSFDAASGSRSSFSNYSPTYVQISAPGSGRILSTWPNNGYQVMQGTSMAAPIVSGAAALTMSLLKSEGVTPSPTDVIRILRLTAKPNSSLATYFTNGAMFDLERLGRFLKSRYLMNGDGGTE